MLEAALHRATVIGAAGKMGRGITLLLLQEVALLRWSSRFNNAAVPLLYCHDQSVEGLATLPRYFAPHLKSFAERNIIALRKTAASDSTLVSNSEIIEAFCSDALDSLVLTSDLKSLCNATLVLEAIAEDPAIKTALYSKLATICPSSTFFFSNTSSIPIHELSETSNCSGRIVGFHFYNPPPVQKLVELIIPNGTAPQAIDLAKELGARLKKSLIPSNDIAGFIGNGHFIREIAYASHLATTLPLPLHQAITVIDTITREDLVRPMGIFQLCDYVGLDIADNIAKAMEERLRKNDLHSSLIREHLLSHIRGGQNSDGSQKEGLFRYEKGRPTAVYNITTATYSPIDPSWALAVGAPLENVPLWKSLSNNREAIKTLAPYFKNLASQETLRANLATDFARNSSKIGNSLIADGVAENADQVNSVITLGFYHLYGPINTLFGASHENSLSEAPLRSSRS